ncbi:uncharacterized protein [Physcomitrium patens]|uniref:uncharacterized protein isoform X1 n=1 Tax=Physcomitrium patens TaxID=3218 RepID=UPI003CCE0923
MENEEARRIPNGGKKLLRHVLATTVFYVGEENRTTWFQHVCVDWLERRRCQIVSHFGDVELDAEVREYCRTRWVSITEYCVCATGPPREALRFVKNLPMLLKQVECYNDKRRKIHMLQQNCERRFGFINIQRVNIS